MNSEFPLAYAQCDGWTRRGWVTSLSSATLCISICGVTPGTVVTIETPDGGRALAEVRAVDGRKALCTPLDAVGGVTVGAKATAARTVLGAYCGFGMLGQCVDAWGRGEHAHECLVATPQAHAFPIDERRPITRSLRTGIAAIDALCTICVGQRIALFSGAGVGKSTLLRHIAEQTELDAQVVALIGERGREASESVAALRESPRWRSTTVVCATADASPRERFAAARTALAQADWLCERGYDVLLTVDSLTRVANAWRELALAAGEQPAHRGHPASMIGMLAAIVERAGARSTGSITGIFAVLVDGDDPFEPVTDAVRGLLDGHIVLSRRLADAGRFPPIDILRSSSRVMGHLASPAHLRDAALVRKTLATLEGAEDLFAIGAYKPGGDVWLDAAVGVRDRMEDWLFHDSPTQEDAVVQLEHIASALRSYGLASQRA